MAKLLYIEASPRKQRSSSIAVAKVFKEEYLKNHANDEWHTIDLWKKELPAFDGDVIDSKYAILHGKSPSAQQKQSWSLVENLIEEFKSADKYVISLPMWNFSIPYKLKHYIDLLVQPGYTFSYDPKEGYKGLVLGKPILLIYARGGAYGPQTGMGQFDLQIHYMETILGFIGFKDFRSVIIEPTLSDPEQKTKVLEAAKEIAKKEALKF